MAFPKRLLQRMELIPSRQSLDGSHGSSVRLHHKHQATTDRNVIDLDRTRAANTVLAAQMCPSQSEIEPEKIGQRSTGLDL
jgi:hypothetical protein